MDAKTFGQLIKGQTVIGIDEDENSQWVEIHLSNGVTIEIDTFFVNGEIAGVGAGVRPTNDIDF